MSNLPYTTRDLIWMGRSREDLSGFPRATKITLGAGLRQAQNGEMPAIAAPLTSYGTGVYELRCKHAGEAYRAVYAIKLRKGIYVLDAFHKKSKSGKAIPREIKERIERRLKDAKRYDEERTR
jgi:phage-related protein